MRLGRASAYGMLAMISIAEASSAKQKTNGQATANGHRSNGAGRHPRARTRALQISQSTGIPVEYLRKVLQRLSRARLVLSERGRSGGFQLTKPASKISLLQIVEATEGPVDDAALLGDGSPRQIHPRLKAWRRHAAEEMRDLLEAQSLADLMK